MKVKVIMPFKDKVTGKTHKPGEVIDCTAERLAEIKKAGKYVVPLQADKEATPEKK